MKLRCFWKGEKNNKNNFIDFSFFKIGGLTELGRVAQYTWCDWFYFYMPVCLCCILKWLPVSLSLCFSIFHLSPYIFTVKLIFFYFASPLCLTLSFLLSFFLPYFPFYSTLCFLPFNESFIFLSVRVYRSFIFISLSLVLCSYSSLYFSFIVFIRCFYL
jgi:hypothetical protein